LLKTWETVRGEIWWQFIEINILKISVKSEPGIERGKNIARKIKHPVA